MIYNAAVDVHAEDKLGLLEMSLDGIEERDKIVLSYFKERQVPVATTIGGGYGGSSQQVAERHSLIFKAVKSVFSD